MHEGTHVEFDRDIKLKRDEDVSKGKKVEDLQILQESKAYENETKTIYHQERNRKYGKYGSPQN